MTVKYQEFLSKLSEEEAKLYEENLAASPDSELIKSSTLRPVDFVSQGFLWVKTPQGQDYWCEVANRFLNKTPQP